MDKTQALEKLRAIGRQELLTFFDTLSQEQQQHLLAQIEQLNIPTLRIQQQILLTHKAGRLQALEPFDNALPWNEADAAAGEALIAQGKVGCLIVAGGQGTRLNFNGPKGLFPVSPIKRKTLFQLFAEKTLACGRKHGCKLPLAIMTSPQNYRETLQHFATNAFFGLDPDQVSFFVQGELPLLNEEETLFLDETSHIAMGPDGNGSSLKHFVQSGIWDSWYAQGVRYVNYILVDNPLADPFDARLIGYQHEQTAEVAIKCTLRQDPAESVGILVKQAGQVKVVEYSELPAEERQATGSDGSLKHKLANLSLFSFTMDFIKRIAKQALPLHPAHKVAKRLDKDGHPVAVEKPNAWKFEEFIFDVLPLSYKTVALTYPRERCFAPLKNAKGKSTPEDVQKALVNLDRLIFAEISGLPAPERPFELAQEFHYPTEELKERWQGRPLPDNDYITPEQT